MRQHLTELARHMEWADATVWNVVMANRTVAMDAELADTLHHIHLVQHIFSQAWAGGEFSVRPRGEFDGLDGILAWGRAAHRQMHVFLDATDPADFDRDLRLPWAAHFEQGAHRSAGVHTLGESILQVALHTAHHRGQVCRRLRHLGVEPPLIDFIVWLWSGRPAAEWATDTDTV